MGRGLPNKGCTGGRHGERKRFLGLIGRKKKRKEPEMGITAQRKESEPSFIAQVR